MNFTRSSKCFPLLISIISALSRLSSSQLAFLQKPISARHFLRLPAAVSRSRGKEIESWVSSVQHVPLCGCPAAADEPGRCMEAGKPQDVLPPSKGFERAQISRGGVGEWLKFLSVEFLCSLACKSHSAQVVLGTIYTEPV